MPTPELDANGLWPILNAATLFPSASSTSHIDDLLTLSSGCGLVAAECMDGCSYLHETFVLRTSTKSTLISTAGTAPLEEE
ncbi:hypothetical protein CPC08DRAFT_713180 [Agrocybe pediades]|nr:hypothetical protein CPC08DRAFT_713180 [Agrocybe pediades]